MNVHKVILILFFIIGNQIRSCAPFNYHEKGVASFYHDSLEGNLTASGTIFSQDSLIAAHNSLPFGTQVLVRSEDQSREVWVTIRDRGPFVKKRIIDLSKAAAAELGMIEKGIMTVHLFAFIPEE